MCVAPEWLKWRQLYQRQWRRIDCGQRHYYLTNLLWARRGPGINDTGQDNGVIYLPCKWLLLWCRRFLSECAVWVCIFTSASFHSSIIPMDIWRCSLYIRARPPTCSRVLCFPSRLFNATGLDLPSKESTYGFFLLSPPDFGAMRGCQYCTDSIWPAAVSQQGIYSA